MLLMNRKTTNFIGENIAEENTCEYRNEMTMNECVETQDGLTFTCSVD